MLAYIIKADGTGAVQQTIFEDGEYWTGAYQYDMTKYRVATPEEIAEDERKRKACSKAVAELARNFGITDDSRQAMPKFKKEYDALHQWKQDNYAEWEAMLDHTNY